MTQNPVRITSSATTVVTAASVRLKEVVIACSNAGTSWKLKVQNGEATPKIAVPEITMALPTDGPVIISFFEAILMRGGIEIVTSGTPGVADVWCIWEGQE